MDKEEVGGGLLQRWACRGNEQEEKIVQVRVNQSVSVGYGSI